MSPQGTNPEPIGVLFVCLGNICRSPLARVVFEDLVVKRGVTERFLIDSCGTGAWHVGGPADPRSVRIAARHGIELRHVARQWDPSSDPEEFEHIIAMDRSNVRDLIAAGAPAERVRLLRSFDPSMAGKPDLGLGVPDPYTGPDDGFAHVFQMVKAACEGLLNELLRHRA